MSRHTRDLIEYARSMSGVVTRAEALALGVPSSTLDGLVRQGILDRPRPGVFALPGMADEHLTMLHAACRKLGAVSSHMSAAKIHQLATPPYVKPTVSVPRRRTKTYPGVTVHQLTDLTDDHIETVEGLPVTTAERTVIDLAAELPERQLEKVVDHGLSSSRLDLELLTELHSELGRQGKPGTVKTRAILSVRSPGYVAPESELERRLLLLIDQAGLPDPTRQFRPDWLAPTRGRVDLAYPKSHLIVEGDSRRWHTMLNSFEIDRRRDNAAQLAGWRILRFTWSEITQHPERVATSIGTALQS